MFIIMLIFLAKVYNEPSNDENPLGKFTSIRVFPYYTKLAMLAFLYCVNLKLISAAEIHFLRKLARGKQYAHFCFSSAAGFLWFLLLI